MDIEGVEEEKTSKSNVIMKEKKSEERKDRIKSRRYNIREK